MTRATALGERTVHRHHQVARAIRLSLAAVSSARTLDGTHGPSNPTGNQKGAALLEGRGPLRWRRARRIGTHRRPTIARNETKHASLTVTMRAERGIGRVGPWPDPSPTPTATGHFHSGRSKTVDPRRKHSQRRENDTAFGPESLSGTTKRHHSRGAAPKSRGFRTSLDIGGEMSEHTFDARQPESSDNRRGGTEILPMGAPPHPGHRTHRMDATPGGRRHPVT